MTLSEHLESLLPAGTRLDFGQLLLSRHHDGTFEARHRDDAGTDTGLTEVTSARDLRELAKNDAEGEYRPLKTAPSLKPGWKTETTSAEEFLNRLDAVYPACFATWVAYDKEGLEPVSLRRTLDRQTGMYRFAGTITDAMANRILSELCARGCLRHVTWPVADLPPGIRIRRTDDSLPLLCTEACTFAVSRARELAKEAFEMENPPARGGAGS